VYLYISEIVFWRVPNHLENKSLSIALVFVVGFLLDVFVQKHPQHVPLFGLNEHETGLLTVQLAQPHEHVFESPACFFRTEHEIPPVVLDQRIHARIEDERPWFENDFACAFDLRSVVLDELAGLLHWIFSHFYFVFHYKQVINVVFGVYFPTFLFIEI